ncbi:MAG: hypothetical protein ACD_76C00094G0032 [uncultured bacterium]|nr:MAG: hypothetical protein ACD_76C00094G0032 [uncultured bacterium]HBD05287.1 asparagine--tRNA ligase [Candidatus Uhrbacteria bacterium]
MERMQIAQIKQKMGQEIELAGWTYNFRSSGKIFFLQLRDGSGRVQIVYSKASVPEDQWKILEEIKIEASVIVRGTVKEDSRSESGCELDGAYIEIIQNPPDDYPISKKEHGPDFLLDNRHLWLRSEKQWAIQRVRNTIINATYEFFNSRGYIKIDTPILTPTSCEGTTELFEMEYFDLGKAYLAQSGQLYLEAAAMSHGKVFDFGPVFRAEKSKTRRHLTEFWMMDAEAAFVGHDENIGIQEALICKIVSDVLSKNEQELKILERDIDALRKVQAPFVRMTHAEAVNKLRDLGSDIGDNDDLGGDDETILTKMHERPIFVEKYPAIVKAFYMKRDPVDPTRVLNADLLAPEGYGEIIGGSEREDDYNILVSRIKEHNLPIEAFSWYADLRKYGSVPHSGFGYGLERITTWICGLQHVRETIPFPRLMNRLNP